LVNLVVVAVVVELQASGRIAGNWWSIAIGWTTLLAAVVVAALVAPWVGDNRPRLDVPLTPDSIPVNR
jgi:hypothetical protein